jgi:hypothetical protein
MNNNNYIENININNNNNKNMSNSNGFTQNYNSIHNHKYSSDLD